MQPPVPPTPELDPVPVLRPLQCGVLRILLPLLLLFLPCFSFCLYFYCHVDGTVLGTQARIGLFESSSEAMGCIRPFPLSPPERPF